MRDISTVSVSGEERKLVSAAVRAPELRAARAAASVSMVEPVWLIAKNRSLSPSMRAETCWACTSGMKIAGIPIVVSR